METLALYALKVVLISVLFYGYYYFVLRNRSFHSYNRFYLLLAILLSIILPVIPFEALFRGNGNVSGLVRYDYVGQLVVIPETTTGFWNQDTLLLLIYSGISTGLMVLFLFSLWRLFLIKKRGIKNSFQDFTLIKTRSGGTPYSFFRNIFWDPKIEIDSEEGAGMLRHELVHIRQHHSADKLAMNLVQILFWFNPIFWMMKNELSMIHEFLADKEAFGERGAADFSKMALSAAFPGYTWPAKNNFFHKPLKRRLIMLLKNNQQRAAYWGRITALPLVVLMAVFFSFKASAEKEAMAVNKELQKVNLGNRQFPVGSLQSVNEKLQKANPVTILDTVPGRKDLSETEVSPAPHSSTVTSGNKSVTEEHGVADVPGKKDGRQPVYILEGKEIPAAEVNSLSPDAIQSIHVLKDESAVSVYGEKGKNGIIEIELKK